MTHFTRDELDRLARTPEQEMADALADGPAAARATYDAVERRFRGGLRGFARWEAGSLAALAAAAAVDPGAVDRLQALATTEAWRIAAHNGVTAGDEAVVTARHGEAVEASASDTTDAAAALALYRRIEGSFLRLHDAHRDTVSAIWSALHEVAGREGLEACLRRLADETLLVWMARDLPLPFEDRVREWATVLTANFARVRIDEHPDRVTFVQDPCGTCTRQILDAGDPLPAIAPWAPVQVGHDDVPLYRAHVGLMHWLMPTERLGHPWPEIRCPTGSGTGPCRIDLLRTPA